LHGHLDDIESAGTKRLLDCRNVENSLGAAEECCEIWLVSGHDFTW
jgi:hypothetical protein